ncbi:biliverdin-producing heme oxygenase [Jannaschia ovalis]|uniref:Biliverdin-producing heme oxygenase n=1 Tax=Jannaschia ovalis TaxID=3038773 RepID=A0ABY8LE01_9RHOB|nr:biliverdin-producing heme oxygenase [Jannaschia sp. GRR-S6-38]WGH79542.1 biliverdin-producing heme oxygenase [Jannaschia sp. GRR-S6-38]
MTLRDRLRADTRPAHDRVDAAFSGLGVTERRGYRAFLAAHLVALSALRPAPGPGDAALAAEMADLRSRLRADLQQLGANGSMPPLPGRRCLDPRALGYVLHGSRMGMAVLHRRWRAAGDARLRRAGAFLSTPPAPARWGAICAGLSRMSPDGPTADRVIAEAGTVFAIYEHSALSQARPLKGCPDAQRLAPAQH